MLKTGLFGAGGLLLAIGIALWVYGTNLEPTIGEAISNVFDQDFSDKRDILIYSGIGLTVLGAVSLLSGIVYGFNKRS